MAFQSTDIFHVCFIFLSHRPLPLAHLSRFTDPQQWLDYFPHHAMEDLQSLGLKVSESHAQLYICVTLA